MNFQYKLRDPNGKVLQGFAEATDRSALIREIQSQGLKMIAIMPVAEERKSKTAQPSSIVSQLPWYAKPIGRGVKPEELLFFTRDLFSVVKAGMPLVGGIRDIAAQVKNAYLKVVLTDVSDQIDRGMKPSEAFEKHSSIFSELYVQSIRAGEESGKMDKVLERLCLLLERDIETERLIKSAVRYPLTILAFLAGAFILMVTVVIPKISNLFTQFQAELPLPTKIIIAVGNFSQTHGFFLLTGLAGFWIFTALYFKTSAGKLTRDALLLKIPVMGALFQKILLSRFASTFQTLYGSGLVIPEALTISSKTVDNQIISKAILQVRDGVIQGRPMSETMRANRLFPPLVIQMIYMGEKTGNLEEMSGQVIHHYEREVQYITKNLASMIEPILTVCLGLMVLVLALGVFMPMWNVMKLLRA